MLDTQLIIVTGMSGAGKSTMAQNLARQYEKNHIPYLWLHEEIDFAQRFFPDHEHAHQFHAAGRGTGATAHDHENYQQYAGGLGPLIEILCAEPGGGQNGGALKRRTAKLRLVP